LAVFPPYYPNSVPGASVNPFSVVCISVNLWCFMNKKALALAVILLTSSIILTGILLTDLWDYEASAGKLYTFPLSVRDKTYVVTVGSNYSSAPKVYLPQVPDNLVSVDFIGDPENAFCNITLPTDLISGNLTVIAKYYEMSEDSYTKSSNSTHNSFYFIFNQIALIKHFEIRGTEGAIA